VQLSPNTPPVQVDIPYHRTDKFVSGESVYYGVLYASGGRKVYRSFIGAHGSGEEEISYANEIPFDVRKKLEKDFDRLEKIYR
jgi:hypothetical protein